MTRKIEEPDVQRQRRDNYVTHFESRQQVKAMEPDQVMRLRNVAEVVRAPRMNTYGCDDYSEEEWKQIIDLANQSGVPANLCLKWYHSDKDWDTFLINWQYLPEVGRDQFVVLVENKRPIIEAGKSL